MNVTFPCCCLICCNRWFYGWNPEVWLFRLENSNGILWAAILWKLLIYQFLINQRKFVKVFLVYAKAGLIYLARTSFINALLRIFKIVLSWMIKINALSKKNLIFVWELQGQLEQANKESISSYNKSKALDGNQSILAKTILSHCLKCLIV